MTSRFGDLPLYIGKAVGWFGSNFCSVRCGALFTDYLTA
jgi:hypothetical protein